MPGAELVPFCSVRPSANAAGDANRNSAAAAPAADEAASAPASSDEDDELLLDGQDEDADAQREILAALRAEGEGEELAHAAAAQRIIAERVAAERPRRSARLAGVPEEQA